MLSRWLVLTGAALALAQPSAGATLVSFGFDEGLGTTALNAGTLGAALNGTLTDGAGYSSDTPSGAGFSLSLDGVNDFVRVTTSFAYGSALTVEAWIQASAVNGQRVIWDDWGNPGVLLMVNDGALQFFLSTATHPGSGISVFTPVLLVEDRWTHVAGVYDGAEIRAYVNGVFAGSAATSGAVIDNPVTASAIGADNVVTNVLNFAGRIDDFRIHDVALDPSELGYHVPEPSLAALLAAGGLAAGVVRSRRSSARNRSLVSR
jgi:hypothetical protein